MEILAQTLKLDLVPADTDTETEAAAGKFVQAGGLFGDKCRLELREDQHAGGEADLLRAASREAEQHERIVASPALGPHLPILQSSMSGRVA